MAARGEISRATVARWEAETVRRLPKSRRSILDRPPSEMSVSSLARLSKPDAIANARRWWNQLAGTKSQAVLDAAHGRPASGRPPLSRKKPSRKNPSRKKPCCASCARGLPCEGGCKHKHHHHGHHHGPRPTKTKTVLNRKRLLRHLKEDSHVFHELLADDRGLIQRLQREERAMAAKKTSKKKKTTSKKTTGKKKKVVRRKKKAAPPMSRKTACIVLCREKYTKKARKKK